MKLFNETQWTPEVQNQILQELKNWLQQVRSGELTVDEQFLDQLASRQDAHGFWGLGVTEDMPRDVRFDAITLPTAMLSAGLMEQAMRHGSSAQLERLLKPALQFLGDHGFQGHGYDRVRGYLQVLQILKSESVEVFVRQHGDMSPAIHQRMLDAPIQLSQIVQTNNDDWLIGEDERNLAQELIQPILQPDEKLYFAYGSNMDVAQMETRCPSARFIGLAIVEDYTLNYRKSCSGYFATLDQQENQVTPGVLWAINPNDEAKLDYYEGVDQGCYYKAEIRANLAGTDHVALGYLLPESREARTPSDEYLQIIETAYTKFRLGELAEQFQAKARRN